MSERKEQASAKLPHSAGVNSLPSPISQQNQLHAQALRRQVAIGFQNMVGQCRIALKYSVIGWTSTIAKEKIPSALANSTSIHILKNRMTALDKALEPFLLTGKDMTAYPTDNSEINADTLSRIQYMRDKLLNHELGERATRCIALVLDEIEKDARVARILPPQDQNGWAWSWTYDDWFRWDASEKKWVSARQGWRMDLWL